MKLVTKHHLKVSVESKLRRWANGISTHYFAPVYLVGSSLEKPDYRDVDIVVIIPDLEFFIRYGEIDEWKNSMETGIGSKSYWSWSKDCHKKWYNGSLSNRVCLDFKVLPAIYDRVGYAEIPKYRLDDNPNIINEQP
jgi:hypothetical protein